MMFPPVQRHLPKSPLPRRDKAIRAELTHFASRLLEIERDQQIEFRRIAQMQQELDDIKRILKTLASHIGSNP